MIKGNINCVTLITRTNKKQIPKTNECTTGKLHNFYKWIQTLYFQDGRKNKRNSNNLRYVPDTKTESASHPSRSLDCKLCNIRDINQKTMLLETRWKKCCISKLEHILHRLGSVLSHQIREAPVVVASVENTCIPHEVSKDMFAFETPCWLCLHEVIWGGPYTSNSTVHSSLSLTLPHDVLTYELCVSYGRLLWYFPLELFGSMHSRLLANEAILWERGE